MKAGLDGFLDVARQTFCRVTEQARARQGGGRQTALPADRTGLLLLLLLTWLPAQPACVSIQRRLPALGRLPQVHELAGRLRQQHSLPAMRVNYAAKRGFYLVIGAAGGRGGGRQKHPRDLEDCEDEAAAPAPAPSQHTYQPGGGGRGGGRGQQGGRIGGGGAVRVPPGFAVLQRSGSSVQATTPELNALNARLRDAAADCLSLTEQARAQQGRCRRRGWSWALSSAAALF